MLQDCRTNSGVGNPASKARGPDEIAFNPQGRAGLSKARRGTTRIPLYGPRPQSVLTLEARGMSSMLYDLHTDLPLCRAMHEVGWPAGRLGSTEQEQGAEMEFIKLV